MNKFQCKFYSKILSAGLFVERLHSFGPKGEWEELKVLYQDILYDMEETRVLFDINEMKITVSICYKETTVFNPNKQYSREQDYPFYDKCAKYLNDHIGSLKNLPKSTDVCNTRAILMFYNPITDKLYPSLTVGFAYELDSNGLTIATPYLEVLDECV